MVLLNRTASFRRISGSWGRFDFVKRKRSYRSRGCRRSIMALTFPANNSSVAKTRNSEGSASRFVFSLSAFVVPVIVTALGTWRAHFTDSAGWNRVFIVLTALLNLLLSTAAALSYFATKSANSSELREAETYPFPTD